MTHTLPRIVVRFDSIGHLKDEYTRNIRKGGVFAPGADGADYLSPCMLVLVHPLSGAQLELRAEVVYVQPDEPGKGVGVHVSDFGPAAIAALETFMGSDPGASEPDVTAAVGDPEPVDTAEPSAHESESAPQQKLAVSALHDRIRNLNLAEQMKLAREGGLQERVALERLFGKGVWEAILQNQRVTPPEVARIARMGAAPTPLLEMITSNAGWVSSGEVRRALLSNPRLSEDGLLKVLRASPKPELQLIASQTVHTPRVRKAARTLLAR